MSKAMMALLLLFVAAVPEVNAQGFLANNETNTTSYTTVTTTTTTTMGNSSAAPQNGTAAAGLMSGAGLLKPGLLLWLLFFAAMFEVNAQSFLASNETNTTSYTTVTTMTTTTMGNSSTAPENGKAGLMSGAGLLKPGAFVLAGLSAFVSFWVM